LWREWSSKEAPAGSCGIDVSPPTQIPSVRLFDRPVDKGVRKALVAVDKELDRIKYLETERAIHLKKRLDDAMAVSDAEADEVFSEIYEETRRLYMVFMEALPPERRSPPERIGSFRSKYDHAVGKFIAKLRTETVTFNMVASYFEDDQNFMATLSKNAEIRAEKWVKSLSVASAPSSRTAKRGRGSRGRR
jgi:hypothetical protein